MTTEFERLDQFLDALSRDPNAPTPADLDGELAQLTRALVRAQTVDSAAGAKARVWQKALMAASKKSVEVEEQVPMQQARSIATPPVGTARLFSYVTALTAMILLIVVLGASFNSPGGSRVVGISSQVETATATVGTTSTATPSQLVTAEPRHIDFGTTEPFNATSVPQPAVPITIGQIVTDKLTADNLQARYHLKTDKQGLLAVSASSSAFKVRLAYKIDNMTINETGAPTSDSQVAAHEDVGLYLQVIPNMEITLTVSSEIGHDTGDFWLATSFGQPTVLEYGKPAENDIYFSNAGDHPNPKLEYYTFDAKAGDIVDVRVESDGNDDLTLFMQPNYHTDGYIYGAARFVTKKTSGCIDSYYPQCFDDDSGPGTDPELRHILIRKDSRFDLIVSPILLASQMSHYKITVSRHGPSGVGPGVRMFTILSWKNPALPFVFQGYEGKPLKFSFERLGNDKSFIRLTAVQAGEELTSFTLADSASSTTQIVTPRADGPILLFVEYAQPIKEDAITSFSVSQLAEQ